MAANRAVEPMSMSLIAALSPLTIGGSSAEASSSPGSSITSWSTGVGTWTSSATCSSRMSLLSLTGVDSVGFGLGSSGRRTVDIGGSSMSFWSSATVT